MFIERHGVFRLSSAALTTRRGNFFERQRGLRSIRLHGERICLEEGRGSAVYPSSIQEREISIGEAVGSIRPLRWVHPPRSEFALRVPRGPSVYPSTQGANFPLRGTMSFVGYAALATGAEDFHWERTWSPSIRHTTERNFIERHVFRSYTVLKKPKGKSRVSIGGEAHVVCPRLSLTQERNFIEEANVSFGFYVYDGGQWVLLSVYTGTRISIEEHVVFVYPSRQRNFYGEARLGASSVFPNRERISMEEVHVVLFVYPVYPRRNFIERGSEFLCGRSSGYSSSRLRRSEFTRLERQWFLVSSTTERIFLLGRGTWCAFAAPVYTDGGISIERQVVLRLVRLRRKRFHGEAQGTVVLVVYVDTRERFPIEEARGHLAFIVNIVYTGAKIFVLRSHVVAFVYRLTTGAISIEGPWCLFLSRLTGGISIGEHVGANFHWEARGPWSIRLHRSGNFIERHVVFRLSVYTGGEFPLRGTWSFVYPSTQERISIERHVERISIERSTWSFVYPSTQERISIERHVERISLRGTWSSSIRLHRSVARGPPSIRLHRSEFPLRGTWSSVYPSTQERISIERHVVLVYPSTQERISIERHVVFVYPSTQERISLRGTWSFVYPSTQERISLRGTWSFVYPSTQERISIERTWSFVYLLTHRSEFPLRGNVVFVYPSTQERISFERHVVLVYPSTQERISIERHVVSVYPSITGANFRIGEARGGPSIPSTQERIFPLRGTWSFVYPSH
ncbi:hypothetical protein C7M84_020523 [Penaeus vannamei]|uniref:Uncharacterized protein n=1 Tax=Penaeus vannamei TaxID=6689 RepID=A0A423SBV6_PENVA|nr:hypothetical protein C7M84_020523 [Penaeus vannamei]